MGPYSPCVKAGEFIFVAGQGPTDVSTGILMGQADIETQTRLALTNIKTILEGAGASMHDVVRCGVYLTNGDDFQRMNAVYAEFFGEHKPARTTIVCSFMADFNVEIDCVAYTPATSNSASPVSR
jgi:2-iminobutanoate/2-iminopropanoate deaminase